MKGRLVAVRTSSGRPRVGGAGPHGVDKIHRLAREALELLAYHGPRPGRVEDRDGGSDQESVTKSASVLHGRLDHLLAKSFNQLADGLPGRLGGGAQGLTGACGGGAGGLANGDSSGWRLLGDVGGNTLAGLGEDAGVLFDEVDQAIDFVSHVGVANLVRDDPGGVSGCLRGGLGT